MICITGDVHHAALRTNDQRYLLALEGRTEVQVTADFVERLERHDVPATLFVTGRAFADEGEGLQPLVSSPLVEIGGHTFSAFSPPALHRAFKLLTGSYLGPRSYQDRDIRRTVEAIQRASGAPPRSWRNRAYLHDQHTEELLQRHGVRILSDHVDPGASGPVRSNSGLLSLPINVIPDHEHIYHAHRTPDFVARIVRRFGWRGPFGSQSYEAGIWADLVIEQLEAQQAAGATSTLLLHPLCQYLSDRFAALDRILTHVARHRCVHVGSLVALPGAEGQSDTDTKETA